MSVPLCTDVIPKDWFQVEGKEGMTVTGQRNPTGARVHFMCKGSDEFGGTGSLTQDWPLHNPFEELFSRSRSRPCRKGPSLDLVVTSPRQTTCGSASVNDSHRLSLSSTDKDYCDT